MTLPPDRGKPAVPRLAVVFARGAVSPGDLLRSLDGAAELLFVTDGSAHSRALRGLFESAGEVVELSGDPAADAVAVKAFGPDAIVTYCERMLRVTADLAEALGLPFHSPDTVHLLTDKHAQRRRLREAGLEAMRFALVTSPAQAREAAVAVPMPAVVKPVRGEGSRDTFVVDDADSCLARLTDLLSRPDRTAGGYIVEEYLVGVPHPHHGDYVSVESVCVDSAVHHVGITGKLPLLHPFRETGQFWPSALDGAAEAEIAALTSAALAALGVTRGITHTEIKLTPHGPRVIEVNGRIGGYVNELYGRALGVDLVIVAARVALGQPVRLPDGPRPARVHFQHYTQPPLGARTLAAVEGTVRHPRARHRMFTRPGDRLPGGVSSFDLDLLSGDADTHEQMLEVVDECAAQLRFTFTGHGAPSQLSGRDLRRGPRYGAVHGADR
ncbi:hypothetical protein GCM10009661_62080 [Catellatospora chokoriensis]|uniref:ATP-grasp domain-containing protein n=1 Tax=Catellatospora chokoriensis TaxID=310353 RepID=A0A8J3K899_9ACTN|nr:hypothetical protein Cch02nite_37530 [Catellatospora chokoriensis]